MRPTPDQLLPIYRRSLAVYEAEGRAEQAEIQRRLIERLEAKSKASTQRESSE